MFAFTFCGIAGSGLALAAVTILAAVLIFQGPKAKSLERVCPVLVHLQYQSAFLQLLSLFNHIGYLDSFFARLTERYPGEQAWDTGIILAELVLGPCIVALMVFTIAQTKQVCYKNMMYIAPGPIIQKHIFFGIMTGQILGGSLAHPWHTCMHAFPCPCLNEMRTHVTL